MRSCFKPWPIRRGERACHQPGIGRPVEGGLRELIISRWRSGYLARYEIDDARDLVLVARIRHQRESGYSEEEL